MAEDDVADQEPTSHLVDYYALLVENKNFRVLWLGEVGVILAWRLAVKRYGSLIVGCTGL